ncbi:hypothetical protein [Leeuwenhoekiella marinoflava]|uniref:Uncharacterized protein n=2 Tax=Leeuwenhoekiella marinoflava TaxID=988 RepID=A0A4Q0PKM0_9FLAO|nr:hypothetical protein [Leeuwenhoekiella marinoflava]RXG27199.1 hypothetical protein DSL99_2991 [Leeuwenhoekiella marinoflava]SHF78449.1 hypothetical protein SAMN02745246_03387 [Leeuwenhoekiella marinoflava DSM 3653]
MRGLNRKHTGIRIFWGLIALYMLNICVDSPDLFPNRPENLNINDQESVIELVVEQVFDLGDVIPEYDDNDTEEHTSSKTPVNLDHFIVDDSVIAFQQDFSLLKKQNTLFALANLRNPFLKVDAPPPKY